MKVLEETPWNHHTMTSPKMVFIVHFPVFRIKSLSQPPMSMICDSPLPSSRCASLLSSRSSEHIICSMLNLILTLNLFSAGNLADSYQAIAVYGDSSSQHHSYQNNNNTNAYMNHSKNRVTTCSYVCFLLLDIKFNMMQNSPMIPLNSDTLAM